MARQVQLRRGTTAEHATFTGAVGEATVDTERKAIVVHDNVTPGGNRALMAGDLASGGDVLAATADKVVTTDLIELASAPEQITFASTLSPNLNAGSVNKYTVLTGNATLSLPTGGQPGRWYTYTIIQDGTGGHTFDVHADYLLPGGEAPEIADDPNARTRLAIYINENGDYELSLSALDIKEA